MPNGTIVDTIDDVRVPGKYSNKEYVKIKYTNKDGILTEGWIDSSLIE